MIKKNKVRSIIICIIGGIFLLPILIVIASNVDLETIMLVALRLGIPAVLCLVYGISTYNAEVGTKVKKYREVFSQDKPDKVKYEIFDKQMMGKHITYFIEFYVAEKLCIELVEKKECKKSDNGECYIKVIYNRNNKFKDFKVYMEKEKLNDFI
ncbi:hypothetical protein KYB31_17820 [Clostridium felsineum]|uniref:hypothetical protein n=1 Tax=Clostridium felsineum TaxID=36839 RepID=UPI00214D4806|nr:hypothetical protein [Clostridium felsineum]MCR3760833.1 hypothetical protein [Clostridium felsineum]